MSYLINEFNDKILFLDKTSNVNLNDVINLSRVARDLVFYTKRPLPYKGSIELLKNNLKQIREFCVNGLSSTPYFKGRVELAFGLSSLNPLDDPVFSEFASAVDKIYSSLSNKNPSKLNDRDYKSALYRIVKLSGNPLDVDDLDIESSELVMLPENLKDLTDFITSTLDYLSDIKSPLIKKYSLYCLNRSEFSRFSDKLEPNYNFIPNLCLLALDFLNKSSVELVEEHFQLKDNLSQIDKSADFFKIIRDWYSQDNSPVSLLAYIVKNRLIDYQKLNLIIDDDKKNVGFEDLTDVEIFYKNVLVYYPGLIDNSDLSCVIESLINPPESLSDFDEHSSESLNLFASEKCTDEIIVMLYEKLYNLESKINNLNPMIDLLNGLKEIIYLLDPLNKLHKTLKDGVKSYYDDILKNGKITYAQHVKLKEDLLEWEKNNKDGIGFADTTISLLRLRGLVIDNALRPEVSKSINELYALLNQLDIKTSLQLRSKEPILNSSEKEFLIKEINNCLENVKLKAKDHSI